MLRTSFLHRRDRQRTRQDFVRAGRSLRDDAQRSARRTEGERRLLQAVSRVWARAGRCRATVTLLSRVPAAAAVRARRC